MAESLFGALREGAFVKVPSEVVHHFIMLAFTAPGALIVWFVFHVVYLDLSRSEKAIGYVDPMTQTGVTLGYFAMVGGSLVLGIIALWSAIQILRYYLRPRKT